MKRVNFKKYYDHITTDTFHDVPDDVFDILEEYRKAEQAYRSKINYHKAYYSLDRDDGIEHSALFVSLSPDETGEATDFCLLGYFVYTKLSGMP